MKLETSHGFELLGTIFTRGRTETSDGVSFQVGQIRKCPQTFRTSLDPVFNSSLKSLALLLMSAPLFRGILSPKLFATEFALFVRLPMDQRMAVVLKETKQKDPDLFRHQYKVWTFVDSQAVLRFKDTLTLLTDDWFFYQHKSPDGACV